jgi:hypothetical protein
MPPAPHLRKLDRESGFVFGCDSLPHLQVDAAADAKLRRAWSGRVARRVVPEQTQKRPRLDSLQGDRLLPASARFHVRNCAISRRTAI